MAGADLAVNSHVQVRVQQPRVQDNSPEKENRVSFSSSILSPNLRRSKSIEALLPCDVNVPLEDKENQRQCMLVLMGATAEGHTERIAVQDGYRESEQRRARSAHRLKATRSDGSTTPGAGDGALGSWKALGKLYPETREQR